MNAVLNIQVRVIGRQAVTELQAVQGAVAGVGAASAKAGSSGLFNTRTVHEALNAMQRFGKNLQWVGRQLTFNFTLPLAAAGFFATRWALENERAMTQVRKVYGDLSYTTERVEQETAALARTFEMLSTRFGEHQAEVINVGAAWAAAGSAGVGLARNVQTTLEAAIIGDMELEEATESLIATMAAYGLTSQELRSELALMNIIENQTAVRFRDLIDVVQRAGGAARTAGVDIRHLSAMAAQLVPATGGAAQAGNALRTMISRIMSPTNEAADELNRLGLEVDTLGWTSLTFVQRMERMSGAWEDLTASERAYITSTIASRWQVNRFDVLMQGFIDTQSYYKKALEATADQTRANTVYQSELLRVLESNPKKFEIMTNVIKNSLSSAIIPLLPAILGVIHAIASLAQWFANLDPAWQKLILSGLLFIAVIGPLVQYIGATILLFSQLGEGIFHLGKGFLWLGKAVIPKVMGLFADVLAAVLWPIAGFIDDVLAPAIAKTFGALFKGITKVALGAWRIMAMGAGAAWGAITTIVGGAYSVIVTTMRNWVAIFHAIHAKTAMGATTIWTKFIAFWKAVWLTAAVAFKTVGSWMVTYTRRLGVALQAMWAATTTGIATIWTALQTAAVTVGRAVVLAWTAATTAARAIWAAFAAMGIAAQMAVAQASVAASLASTSAWGRAFVFTRVLFAKLLIVPLAGMFKAVGAAIMAGLTAIAAVVGAPVWAVVAIIAAAVAAIAVLFNRDLRDKALNAIRGVVNGLAQLPSAIASIFRSVVQVIATAVRKVIEWLSYLNPFARHSPSLVDNVKAGVATILDEYERLRHVPNVIRAAAKALEDFHSATSGAAVQYRGAEIAEKRKEVVTAAPASAPMVDNLIAQMFALEGTLPSIAQEISQQAAVVARWSAQLSPVEKKLRAQEVVLQDLEYRYNVLDTAISDAQSVMNELANTPINGMKAYSDAIFENEMAQKSLRLEIMRLEEAGQSVDELRDRYAALGGMIESLRSERDDLRMAGAGSDVLSVYDQEIAALEAQRDALEGQGSEIENLQRQLEELQRQGEMLDLERAINFDPQVRQIDEMVNGLREMPFDEIVRQIEAQRETIARLTPEHTALATQLEAQRRLVEATRYEYDRINSSLEIERQKLSELEQAYSDIESQINEMESALNNFAQTAQAAREAAGGDGRPEFGDYEVPGGDAVLGPEGDLFDIEEFNRELERELEGMLGDMDIFGPIKDAWNRVWTFIKDSWGGITGWFRRNLSLEGLGNVFASTMRGIGSAFTWLGETIKSVWDSLILPVFQAMWGWVEPVLGPIFRALADVVVWAWQNVIGPAISFAWESVIKPVFGALWGFIDGFLIPIFTLFWTIGDIVFTLLGRAITGAWNAVIKPVLGAFAWTITNVLGPVFSWLLHSIIEPIWGAIRGIISGAWNVVIKPVFDAIKWSIENVVAPVFGWLKDNVIGPVWRGIETIIGTAWNAIARITETAVNFFISIFNLLAGAVNAVASVIGVDSRVQTMNNVHIPRWNPGGGGGGGGSGNVLRYERGGMMTDWGYAPFTQVNNGFVTNQVRAIVGEGGAHPEYVIPTDPKYRNRALALFASLGDRLFAAGGTIPALDAGDVIGGVWDASGGRLVSGVADLGGDAARVLQQVWDTIVRVTNMLRSVAVSMVAQVGTHMKDTVWNWARDELVNRIAGILESVRDTAWDWGARLNPLDDIVNIFRATGGTVPQNPIDLATGGIIRRRAGGTLLRLGEGRDDERIQVIPLRGNDEEGKVTNVNIYGNLEFPNIRSGDDAERLIDNLAKMVASR